MATMAITAEMVKKLRDQTGAGMMECKNALSEANGDFEEANTILNEKRADLETLAKGLLEFETLTGDEIQKMALRGRDFMDAVGLLAGVVDTSDSREAPGPTSIGNLYILGGRSNAKNMTIDGVTNLDTGSNGSVHTM